MSLLETWRKDAYEKYGDDRQPEAKDFWFKYFQYEKAIYENILSTPKEFVSGKVSELADHFGVPLEMFVGFLDGIDESLIKSNNLEELTEDSMVSLAFKPDDLYKNMVGCDAEWLYTLPQWDAIYTKEEQKELYLIQKKSGTIVKPQKIGRNDPCPCGSGKKYKKCCGAN